MVLSSILFLIYVLIGVCYGAKFIWNLNNEENVYPSTVALVAIIMAYLLFWPSMILLGLILWIKNKQK